MPVEVAGCEECLRDRKLLGAPAHVHELLGGSAVATRRRIGTRAPTLAKQVIQSLAPAELGEDWSWCYLDEVAFLVEPNAEEFAGDARP